MTQDSLRSIKKELRKNIQNLIKMYLALDIEQMFKQNNA